MKIAVAVIGASLILLTLVGCDEAEMKSVSDNNGEVTEVHNTADNAVDNSDVPAIPVLPTNE